MSREVEELQLESSMVEGFLGVCLCSVSGNRFEFEFSGKLSTSVLDLYNPYFKNTTL